MGKIKKLVKRIVDFILGHKAERLIKEYGMLRPEGALYFSVGEISADEFEGVMEEVMSSRNVRTYMSKILKGTDDISLSVVKSFNNAISKLWMDVRCDMVLYYDLKSGFYYYSGAEATVKSSNNVHIECNKEYGCKMSGGWYDFYLHIKVYFNVEGTICYNYYTVSSLIDVYNMRQIANETRQGK